MNTIDFKIVKNLCVLIVLYFAGTVSQSDTQSFLTHCQCIWLQLGF